MKNLRLIMFVAFAVCGLCLTAVGVVAKEEGTDTTNVDDGLGTKWYQTEYYGKYKGTWTRLTNTSKFKGNWGSLTADLDISRDGNTVTVIRTNSSDGNDCTYTGTINGRNVAGKYRCEKYTPPEGLDWSATIR